MPVNRAAPALSRPLAEHLLADSRVNAVRADQQIAGNPLAVGEKQRDPVPSLFEARAAVAGSDGLRAGGADGIQQHFVKIASMDHPVRRTKSLDRGFPKVERRPTLPRRAQPDFLAGGGADDLLHRRFQSEGDQDTGSVGTELHPGTDLPQFVRLLEHTHMVAALDQCQSGGQPAQAGAGDENIRHWFPPVSVFQPRRPSRANRIPPYGCNSSLDSTAATSASTGAMESSCSTGAG